MVRRGTREERRARDGTRMVARLWLAQACRRARVVARVGGGARLGNRCGGNVAAHEFPEGVSDDLVPQDGQGRTLHVLLNECRVISHTYWIWCSEVMCVLTTCWRFPSIREVGLPIELTEHSIATALDRFIGMDESDPMHSILATGIPDMEFITDPSAMCWSSIPNEK